MTENPVTRINKYLSESGICSRREADRAIDSGEVSINGETAALGDRVRPGDIVRFRGRLIKARTRDIIIAFNKPAGIVCTSAKDEPDNIIDYLNFPERVFTVGRLDKNSEGLILLTNRGDIVNKIMRAANRHEKEYIVKVDKPLTREFIEAMSGGVWLSELSVRTRKCRVERLSGKTFKIILTQGLNRQIRRMCEALGYSVVSLRRVRVVNIKLGSLGSGEWRYLTDKETRELENIVAGRQKQKG